MDCENGGPGLDATFPSYIERFAVQRIVGTGGQVQHSLLHDSLGGPTPRTLGAKGWEARKVTVGLSRK